MINAVVLFVGIFLVLLAKHPRKGRKRMGRYIRGEVDEELALGTLAAKDVISAAFDSAVIERTFISSLVAIWSVTAVTPSTTAGPIMVGVAHSDYSAAEIEEWIENTGSWTEADQIGQEIGRRKIRKVGIFRFQGAAGITSVAVLNEGRAIKTKLGWILTTGQNIQAWAYNLGTGAFATTDPAVDIQGHVNLWPR